MSSTLPVYNNEVEGANHKSFLNYEKSHQVTEKRTASAGSFPKEQKKKRQGNSARRRHNGKPPSGALSKKLYGRHRPGGGGDPVPKRPLCLTKHSGRRARKKTPCKRGKPS